MKQKQDNISNFLFENDVNEEEKKKCLVIAFFQHEVVVLCSKSDSANVNLGLSIVESFRRATEDRKYITLQETNVPFDKYTFLTRMLVNNKVEDKVISIDKEGIKLEGNVLFY